MSASGFDHCPIGKMKSDTFRAAWLLDSLLWYFPLAGAICEVTKSISRENDHGSHRGQSM